MKDDQIQEKPKSNSSGGKLTSANKTIQSQMLENEIQNVLSAKKSSQKITSDRTVSYNPGDDVTVLVETPLQQQYSAQFQMGLRQQEMMDKNNQMLIDQFVVHRSDTLQGRKSKRVVIPLSNPLNFSMQANRRRR